MSNDPPPYDDGISNNSYQAQDNIYSRYYQTYESNTHLPSSDPIDGNSGPPDPHRIYTVVGDSTTVGPMKTRPFFGFIYIEKGICRSPILPFERTRAYFFLFLFLIALPGLFIAYVVHRFITTPNVKIVWLSQVADVSVAAQISYFSFVGQAVGVSIISQVSGFSYVSMASIFSFHSMVSLVSCGSLFSIFSFHPTNGICIWRIRNPYFWIKS